MRKLRNLALRRCLAISSGSFLPGWLQGFGLIGWSSLITSFLAYWLSAIVGALLGGDPNATGGA
jgi:hypothetical protein